MTLGRYILLITTILLCDIGFADNGHLIGTTKTESYNVAVFAEPWPPRVGTMQIQFIITDMQGNLIQDDSILPSDQLTDITLDEVGPWKFQYALQGIPQPPLSFEVLPKASLLRTYWHLWSFLIFGLIFIILREKLANIHARRYPSL